MSNAWVVVADAGAARIFSGKDALDKLIEVETLDHPEGRMKAAELVSGDRGRTNTAGGAHAAFERHTDPHRATVHAFAKEVAQHVVKGLNDRAFQRLIVVSPPQFLGELRHELGPLHGAEVVTVDKDWGHVTIHELPARLHKEFPAAK